MLRWKNIKVANDNKRKAIHIICCWINLFRDLKNKNNTGFSNIDAIDGFIETDIYKQISSGKFHDEWFEDLKIIII